MLTLTDSSISKFKEIVEKEDLPDAGVRLFLTPGG